jgi:hypothetical protein
MSTTNVVSIDWKKRAARANENKVRRILTRKGYRLHKSRKDGSYAVYCATCGTNHVKPSAAIFHDYYSWPGPRITTLDDVIRQTNLADYV